MSVFMAVTTISGESEAAALASRIEIDVPGLSGIATCEVEDGSGLWEITCYFDNGPDDIRLMLLAAASGACPFLVSELQETGWIETAQRQLAPVTAGRFFVHGKHDADKIPKATIPLAVEAAMAFGTGHHGTTRGCLLAIERLTRSGHRAGRVLDIGCGTAVLAMAAARVFDAQVIASDCDGAAVDTARANVESNGLSDCIRVVNGEGFGHPEILRSSPYDLVLANLLEATLVQMAKDFASHCTPGGFAVLSGVLSPRRHIVIMRFEEVGFREHETIATGEWATMVVRKQRQQERLRAGTVFDHGA